MTQARPALCTESPHPHAGPALPRLSASPGPAPKPKPHPPGQVPTVGKLSLLLPILPGGPVTRPTGQEAGPLPGLCAQGQAAPQFPLLWDSDDLGLATSRDCQENGRQDTGSVSPRRASVRSCWAVRAQPLLRQAWKPLGNEWDGSPGPTSVAGNSAGARRARSGKEGERQMDRGQLVAPPAWAVDTDFSALPPPHRISRRHGSTGWPSHGPE